MRIFTLNLIGFFVAMNAFETKSVEFVWLARAFYVWVSIFNLFAFSSAWSLIADIFSKEASQRLFGIIAAGASLGSIAGASSVKIFVSLIGASNLVFASVVLLLLGVGAFVSFVWGALGVFLGKRYEKKNLIL